MQQIHQNWKENCMMSHTANTDVPNLHPNEVFSPGKQYEDCFFCVHLFTLHWFVHVTLSCTEKSDPTKDYFLSHYSSHGDTTECASLSGSHCITRIRGNPAKTKNGSGPFSVVCRSGPITCTYDDILYSLTSETIQLCYKSKLQAASDKNASIEAFIWAEKACRNCC